jgi:hypothetical protein
MDYSSPPRLPGLSIDVSLCQRGMLSSQTQALALNVCLSGRRRQEGDCGRVMTSEGIGVN